MSRNHGRDGVSKEAHRTGRGISHEPSLFGTPHFAIVNPQVMPEEPVMRSVSLLAPPSAAQSAQSGHPKLFGVQPSGFKSLRSSDQETITEKDLKGEVDSFRNTPKSKSSSAEPNWKVNCLEKLPEDFPLERTSRYFPGQDAAVIAARIADCLRTRSIETVFDHEKAKAKCRNRDFVSFRIRLYSSGEAENEGVFVEVQRRKGSPVVFMKDCRAILSAAEGDGVSDVEIPPYFEKPVSEMECLKHVDKIVSEEEILAVLDDVSTSLQDRKRDQHVLSFEQLDCLTNTEKTSQDMISVVSKNVFKADRFRGIRSALSVLIATGSLRPEFQNFDISGEVEDDMNDVLRSLSLRVLSNICSSLAKDGCLSEAAKEQHQWLQESLVPSLVGIIAEYNEKPMNSQLAVHCLASLSKSSEMVRVCALDAGIVEMLEGAASYSINRHELLRNEVSSCLDLFGQC